MEEERPMEADLFSRVGTSNGCTVGSSVDSVIVVGDLLGGHPLLGIRRSVRVAERASGRSYIASALSDLGALLPLGEVL